MIDFLGRLFQRSHQGSKHRAKERLQLVLVHDRAALSPQLLDQLKEELIAVISKYMEIDESGPEVSLERDATSVALVANIPIKRVHRHLQAAGNS